MSTWGTQSKYGDFEIIGAKDGKPRLLGKGSFGKTFEAVRIDTVAGQDIKDYVAIKVLDPTLFTTDANRYQFIQELVSLTKFKGANLIHYVRAGEQNGEVYYAMDLCRGGDLSRMVRRYGPLPEKIVALIAQQVAAGLREVHVRHRLVHRDIKPSNIMLEDELESDLTLQYLGFRFKEQESLCRIVDFGLVDFTMNAQEAGKQRFVGSPMYASPEQICEQPVDARSDIYSLGMTLWYLLQGKGPLLDVAGEELKSMREAMIRHTLPEEHEKDFPKHLSPEFRRILSKMVAKQAQQRYSSAAELQSALRHYLANEVTEPPPKEPIEITRLDQTLDTAFVLEDSLPSRLSTRSYVAVEKTSGDRVKLNAVADLQQNDPQNVDALSKYLCDLAELSQQSALPPALLPVRNVILASDTLACTEEMLPHVALADVLRARAVAKRNISFSEAVTFLRPIAEGLDFMLQNGRDAVFLPCEEVWLTGKELLLNPQDVQMLSRPLSDWEDLQVRFSMMCLPCGPSDGSASGEAAPFETLSGSVHMSNTDLHPVSAFVRLVYRTLNGSEVPAAAGFTPKAYVQAVTLKAASNVLLRDLLCRQKPWTTVTSVLKDLCANEGVPWRQAASKETNSPAARSEGGPGSTGVVRPSARATVPGSTIGRGGRGGAAPTDRIGGSYASAASTMSRDPAPAPPASRGSASSMSSPPEEPPEVDELARTVAASISPPAAKPPATKPPIASPPAASPPSGSSRIDSARGSSMGSAPRVEQSVGSVPRVEQSMGPGERERPCEVVSPGIVRSPYDRSHADQAVPAEQWVPLGRVKCRFTQKYFRLPRRLDPLIAQYAGPGLIQSPYAAPGAFQNVPWDDWAPGGKVVCEASGKPLTLPLDLPLPEGTVSPENVGTVISPFDRRTVISVPPEQWVPRTEIVCPATQMSFVLPEALPPLFAVADPENPGVFSSPYAVAAVWQLPPSEWVGGAQVTCPVTRRELALPFSIEQWPAKAAVVDAAARLVSNPYRPGSNLPIPVANWFAGARITCPETGRTIVLPDDLPPLTGALVDDRPGLVRSPFSGDIVEVALKDWVPGGRITCPTSHSQFVLPATLPEWIAVGSIAGLAAGMVKSPYEPFAEVEVPALQWLPNQRLTCPKTGRRFSLPAELPLLQGTVQEGHPGRVLSPFSSEWQDLSLDEWKPRQKLECAVTKRAFLLPQTLEEWLVDGAWIQGEPGVVCSPFRPHPKIEVPADQWAPGGLLTCPATNRRFRIPADPLFPSLKLEKEAMEYALGEPQSSAEAAAQALRPAHPATTSEQIQSIWQRHALGTVEERMAKVETGEVIPDAPGFIQSPYGSKPKVKVTPAQWAEPHSTAKCSETGRCFKLPSNLPPLLAIAMGDRPGILSSPYSRETTWEIGPQEWIAGRSVTCPASENRLTLPPEVENWAAPATVTDVIRRRVSDPFRPGTTVEVSTSDWTPSRRVQIPETGRFVILPEDLPPLVAEIIEGRTGVVRSPYSGEEVEVALNDWTPNGAVICPKSRSRFLLPATLPEWVPVGTVAGLPAGKVRSPYGARPDVTVSPDEWMPNQRLVCPATGRPFTLPAELAFLEGEVQEGQPGKVLSPFSVEWQEVSLDDWNPGQELDCLVTGRPFVLPSKIEEWLVDGTWLPGFPGRIRSPFRSHKEVDITPGQWKRAGLVTCAETGRRFRIPDDPLFPPLALEKEAVHHGLAEPDQSEAEAAKALLRKYPGTTAAQVQSIWNRHGLGSAEDRRGKIKTGEIVVDSPGTVRSPYDSRQTVEVPAAQWVQPHAMLHCPETGRPFILPDGLPPLRARLVPGNPGTLTSPYAPEQPFQISPADWKAGQMIRCAKTNHPLQVPAELPEWIPQGSVDESRPGTVRSPFRNRRDMEVEGLEWIPGATVTCQETGYKFALPAKLPPLRGKLVEGGLGHVLSPYSPGFEIAVPPNLWKPGGLITCQKTNRAFTLPPDLPPLAGELVEERTGVIRSPYTNEVVEVALNDWVAGGRVICSQSHSAFTLPLVLPEWIGVGSVAGMALGTVRSPYGARPEVEVPAAQWASNQILTCPETKRRFSLPAELPPLEAGVKEGDPGRALSPFSSEWQAVLLDDWKPGQRLECTTTHRPFVLPAKIEEWIVDGKWVPRSPGKIRSPFSPNPEMDIPPKQWKSGALLTCPATRRRFRIPEDKLFPSLELERAAVTFALSQPEASEDVAAETLEREYPGTTPPQVQSIWERHALGTILERRHNVQAAEVLPDHPGTVRSPYGSRPRLEVPPEEWIQPGATLHCPETGRAFVLPGDLPPLQARVVPEEPGMVASPFAPDVTFQVAPDTWKPGARLSCPQTGRPLQMPTALPEWNPVGTVMSDQPGKVVSPFGERLPMQVSGADWVAGGRVTCVHSGYDFALPKVIPPMTGTVVTGKAGVALSPYAPNSEAQVTRKRWVPGGGAVCPRTGRLFLLPQTLPVWKSKPFPWKLVAVPVILLIAGIVWLVNQKTETGANQAGTAAPGPAVWPQRFIFLGIVPEPPQGSIALVADATEKNIPFTKDDASMISVNLETLLKDKAILEAKALQLKITVPGYAPELVEIKKTPTKEETDTKVRSLKREAVKVTLAAQGANPFYNALRFEMKDNPLHRVDERERERTIPLAAGNKEETLGTGKYTISLVRDPALPNAVDASIRVQDRVIYPARDVTTAGDTIPIPGLGVPALSTGHTEFEIAGAFYVVRDDTHRKFAPDGRSQPCVVKAWTPTVLKFDSSFKRGVLIEENSLNREYIDQVLDILAREIFLSKNGPSFGQAPGDDTIKSNLNRFIEAQAPPRDFSASDATPIIAQRNTMFDAAQAILTSVLTPANSKNPLIMTCEWYHALRGDESKNRGEVAKKMDAWKALFTASLGGSDRTISAQELETLTKSVKWEGGESVGLFVNLPFTVTSVGANGEIGMTMEYWTLEQENPGKVSVQTLNAHLRPQNGNQLTLVREFSPTDRKQDVTTQLSVSKLK